MTELKTIKEIIEEKIVNLQQHEHFKYSRKSLDKKFDSGYINTEIIFPDELKQTAIKWINEYESMKLPLAIPENTRDYGRGLVIDFIKHFFNITKEDIERARP